MLFVYAIYLCTNKLCLLDTKNRFIYLTHYNQINDCIIIIFVTKVIISVVIIINLCI